MSIRFQCRAKVGEYEKNGERKAKYATVGVVLRTQSGFVMKLDTLPVNFDGTIFLSEPETPEQRESRQNGGGQQRSASPQNSGNNYGNSGGDDLDF